MTNRHLVSLRPGPGTAVFIVHAIVGHVSKYGGLARHLAPDFDVHGLQATPFFLEGARCTSVSQMVALYKGEIMDAGLARDSILIGYCLGGVIALELASQLTSIHRSPTLLVLIDAYVPTRPLVSPEGELGRGGWLAFVEACLGLEYVHRIMSDAPFWQQDTAARLAHIHSLTRAGLNVLLPEHATQDELNQVFARFMDYARAVDSHAPSRGYAGPTLCIGTPPSCENINRLLTGTCLAGPVDTIVMKCRHTEFLLSPIAEQIAGNINQKARPS